MCRPKHRLSHCLAFLGLAYCLISELPANAALSGKVSLITQRDPSIVALDISGFSSVLQLSPDGKFLFFSSAADNLIPNDFSPESMDLFVTDLVTGITSSIAPNAQNLAYAPDAGLVAFDTTESLTAEDTNGFLDVYVKNLLTGKIELISADPQGSPGSAPSQNSSISRDGSIVAFQSSATNLVMGTRNNGIFFRDRRNGATKVVSIPNTGAEIPGPVGLLNDLAVSPDGMFIAYSSDQTNLVANATNGAYKVFLYSVIVGTNEILSVNSEGTVLSGASRSPFLSQDGRYVFFLSATNSPPLAEALYVRDRQSTSTRLITNPFKDDFVATPSGAYVAFVRTNLVYRYEVASGSTRLVSSRPDGTPDGVPANNFSGSPSISDDGRFVAFSSNATNLVPVAGSAFRVYVRDLQNDAVYVVGSPGEAARSDALFPRLSGDGATVAFEAYDELLPGDVNGQIDLFIARQPWLEINRLPLKPLESASALGPAELGRTPLSADGRYVLFSTLGGNLSALDGNNHFDVYLHDSRSQRNELISINSAGDAAGNDISSDPVMTPDGRFVAFTSIAGDLVEGADTNRLEDIYVRDRQLRKTFLVSVAADSTNPANRPSINPSISADGRFVAFESTAGNLSGLTTFATQPNIYLRDLVESRTVLISRSATLGGLANRSSGFPVISPNGRYIAFYSTSTDLLTNTTPAGLFVRDLQTLQTRALGAADPEKKLFSEDSSTLLFTLSAPGAAKLYYFDLNGTAAQLVDTNVASIDSISSNGTLIAYTKYRSTNTPTDVWLLNRTSNSMTLISANTNGVVASGSSSRGELSAQGDAVAFKSNATDLFPGINTGASPQIYLRMLATGETVLASKSLAGAAANGQSTGPRISANGRSMAFLSAASDLVPSDLNSAPDLFLFTLGPVDTDNDSLPDDWEITHFGNLNFGAADDPDGDGMTNLQEFRAGTDPAAKASVLQVLGVEFLPNRQRQITWRSSPGLSYLLEYKTNVTDSTWLPISGEVQAASSTGSKIDPDTTQPRRFYRLRLVE